VSRSAAHAHAQAPVMTEAHGNPHPGRSTAEQPKAGQNMGPGQRHLDAREARDVLRLVMAQGVARAAGSLK